LLQACCNNEASASDACKSGNGKGGVGEAVIEVVGKMSGDEAAD
jgi:hypothetical protein